jgi:hypothetical protein
MGAVYGGMESTLPRQMQILEEAGRLIIRRKWFSATAIILTAVCLIWDAALLIWVLSMQSDGSMPGELSWEMVLPGLHGMVGMGFTYYTLACYLNKTDVILSPELIEVRIWPMKWPGAAAVAVDAVRQLYVASREQRSHNGRQESYEVRLVGHDGRERILVCGLETIDQARFIENEIEAILGIQNRPVSGEVL